MKLSIPALTSLTSSAMHTGQVIEKRKKSGLSKGGGSNAPPDPVPDVGKDIGKDSPLSLPKGGPTPAGAAPSNVGKDIPQSIPTDAKTVVSDINKDSPISIPKPDSIPTGAATAAVSDVGKDIPTSTPKPGPTPAPATAAPSTVTTTVTSTTTVFSSTLTTTVHHTETTTVTGTGTGAVSTPSGPVRAGESLSGAAMTDAILAQCPKTTDTVTRTVSVTPAPVTSLVTQTAFSSASPLTITMTSTVSPQADRAPTCSALPTHTKHVGPAEIMAIAFGLITLALLVAMFFLARKCYKMHRAQRVWGKQVRNEGETELTEIAAGSGGGEEDVGAKPMAVHPARTKLGQRLMDKLAKSFERKESWEK